MFKLMLTHALARMSKRLPLAFTIRHLDGTSQTFGTGNDSGIVLIIGAKAAYRRLVWSARLAFPELYAEGKIEVESPADTGGLFELLRAFYALNSKDLLPGLGSLNWLKRKLQARRNLPPESARNAHDHYDANDAIVQMITGKTKQYSCAFFARPEWTLDAAQFGKMDYLLAKLDLKAGQRLLDIGCGYGGLIRRAAKAFGVKSLGVTLSGKQKAEGDRMIAEENLQAACEIRLRDYRELSGKFDRIVSVGMFEHVGGKAWKEYFGQVDTLLAESGVFVLHTVCLLRPYPMNPFIRKYIFPGAELPAIAEVLQAAEGTALQCRHFENLQGHYATTCLAWLANLRKRREDIVKRFGQWRYRAFEVYLAGGAASFSVANGMQLGQFVFTKAGADWPATAEFMTEWLSQHS